MSNEPKLSNCCSAPIIEDTDICSKCKEHCVEEPNQQIEEVKEWFEANYLDGDKIQEGQMLSSSECLDSIRQALQKRDNYILGLETIIKGYEEMLRAGGLLK